MRYFVRVALQIVLLPLPLSTGLAQEDCGLLCWDCGGGNGSHAVPLSQEVNLIGSHFPCRYCASSNILDCHDLCSESNGSDWFSDAVYLSILHAASRGDVSTIIALAAVSGGRVSMDRNRRMALIHSCNRAVIVAALNVPPRLWGTWTVSHAPSSAGAERW